MYIISKSISILHDLKFLIVFHFFFLFFFSSKLDDLGWSIFQHFAESPLTAKYIDGKFMNKLAKMIAEDGCHLRAMAYLVIVHHFRNQVKFTMLCSCIIFHHLI